MNVFNYDETIRNLKNEIINATEKLNPLGNDFNDIDYIDNVYNLINVYYHLNNIIDDNKTKSFNIVFPNDINFYGDFVIIFDNGDFEIKYDDNYILFHGGKNYDEK